MSTATVPKGPKVTPMVRQYLQVKEQYPDSILFYRLGDFYEMFFEDAEIASRILELTLTSRNKGEEEPIPLCGIPYHSAQPYLVKLLEAGHKVAICEQVEDPEAAKGIVERKVVRVVTPGTVLEEENLDPRSPSYLAAVIGEEGRFGVAVADLSTGELRAFALDGTAELDEELSRLRPKELVAADGAAHFLEAGAARSSRLEAERFEARRFLEWVSERHGAECRARFDVSPLAARAAAGLLAYLDEQLVSYEHLRPPVAQSAAEFLVIDEGTRRNLELVETSRGEFRGSLLWVLDRTGTPMGARTLRRWLLYPLVEPAAIGERLDAVEELVDARALREDLGEVLAGVGDLERLASRIGSGRASPRDLVRLANALERTERIRDGLGSAGSTLLRNVRRDLAELPDVRERIRQTLVDDPPLTSRNGDLVRDGFDPDVDELRDLRRNGRQWITKLEAEERRETGIGSLKIRYNKVFGYYLEVTKANLRLVPDRYHRKQTLAGAERFITPELKEYESKVLGAEERLRRLEGELFDGLVEEVTRVVRELLVTAAALGRLDAIRSLAEVADHQRFVRPGIVKDGTLDVRDGRHPVVERMLPAGRFVPNDVLLDPEETQLVIVTGPNMAGKSTYLRQTALIVLLAQTGSFVPASSARIGVVDRVFTRVGASDDLAAGDSTFMVEMKETAYILSNLTERSLVILDEIGRGTSTFDGISIAWAVAEFLHAAPQRPKTLFATHFHELTELTATAERAVNASVSVREWKGEVVFLHRIVPGAASQSYGIQVARLAGVPEPVIQRAREILTSFEDGARGSMGESLPGGPTQLGLFTERPREPDPLVTELATIDPLTLTPIEALQRLAELVGKVKAREKN